MEGVVNLSLQENKHWSERKDWSPIAQPPGPDEVIAHTADPTGYSSGEGGRVTIPRAKPGKNSGANQGFQEIHPVVNIDPTDPVAGTGGITIDVSKVAASPKSKTAYQESHGNAWQAWATLAQEADSQEQTKQAGNTVQQPPQKIEKPPVRYVEAPPQIQPEPQQPQPPQPVQYYMPPQPPQPDYRDEQIRQLTDGLAKLSSVVERIHQEVLTKPDVSENKKPEPEPEPEPKDPGLAVPADVGLPFLTDPPSRPQVQVVFDLGKGGRHLKRFHFAAVHRRCLSLLYDTRYEGDQFTPPATEEGDAPIKIGFPQHNNKVVSALVPADFNQRLGCIDQLNFVIVDDVDNGSDSVSAEDLAKFLGG